MNVLDEFRSRIEWLKKARQKVEAGELQPIVAEHTLNRFLHNPVRSAVSYCDIDSESGYSDTGEHEAKVKRVRAQYMCEIAAIEKAITKRRENEKVRPILEVIGSISNKLDRLSDSVEREQERRKAGRPRKSDVFSDSFKSENTEFNKELLKEMQMLAKGKIGKDFATLIQVAVDLDLIEKPTFKQCKDAFGDIGARTGYNRYMGLELSKENESLYAQIEKKLKIL
jgi:hypothetical protein